MTYELIKLSVVLGLAAGPLLFLAQLFLANIKKTAAKHLVDMPNPPVTIQWPVRASPLTTAAPAA